MDEKSGIEDRSGYWLEQAEYDLETARAMLQTGRYLYVGFMCQQTMEKGLKGVIAKHGAFPPKIHDLLRLGELANLSDVFSEEQNRLLDELHPLHIEARYPSHKERLQRILNKDVCADYITRTEATLRWIKEQL